MGKLIKLDVLIVGMRGLGVEIGALARRRRPMAAAIAQRERSSADEDALRPPSSSAAAARAAKNLCLAGPKSVTIFDPAPATLMDVGANVSESARVAWT